MKGSVWFDQYLKHLGTDRAGVMAAVRHAVEQGWDVDWPMVEVAVGDIAFDAAADYFAIGDPTDFVYVPLDGPTAQWLADRKGCSLPTRKLVKHIWQAADTRINGAAMPMTPQQGFPYDADMFDVRRLPIHTERVVASNAWAVGGLVAGHKKDVVISNRLAEKPGRVVAIYGLQHKSGEAIQGPYVSIRHVVSYWDYSHGVRLVGRTVRVSAVSTPLAEQLQQGNKSFTDEGPLRVLSYDVPDEDAAPDTDPSPVSSMQLYTEIKRGSTGDAVARWQRYLMWKGHDLDPWRDDGKFGLVTQAATKVEQQNMMGTGEYVLGVVGQSTWALYRDPPALQPAPAHIELNDKGFPPIVFNQSRNYTNASRTDVRHVVIHTMEAAEKPDTAENVAAWFAGPNAPQASAHYNVDGDSIVQGVAEEDVAWHATKGNRYGVGIEHAGYARQQDADWRDPYSSAMLVLSAKLAARICKRWGIPVRYVDEAGLRAGDKGFTYHRTVTKAFAVRGGHHDPGKNFPIDEYLAMVNAELAVLESAA